MPNIKKIITKGPTAALSLSWLLIKSIPMRLLEIIGQFLPENVIGCKFRGMLLRPFLKQCGKNFQMGIGAKLEHPQNIIIGENVYIGHGSWVSGLRGGVELADEVLIGPYVTMVSSNHTFVNGSSRFGPGDRGQITVGRGTWLAAGCTLVAGANVGAGCLIAAGAVVTKDIPDGKVAGGIPAKVLGDVEDNKQLS